MTIREWCSHTYNVFYGATAVTIYQANEPPMHTLVGMIPDDISNKEVQEVIVAGVKFNTATPVFTEVEVICK